MNGLIYKTVTTRSGQTGYTSLGSGDPLVMILGYSGTLFHWNKFLIQGLAQYFTVYLIDNRKVGVSNSNNEDSIYGVASDIVDFIIAMKLEQPVIFGWSMGGAIVQQLVKSHPQVPKKIILMSTVPQIPYTNLEFTNFLKSADSYNSNEFRNRLYWFFFSEENPNVKSYLADSSLPLVDYHYRFTPEARDLQDTIIPNWPGMSHDDLSSIKIPTLLLWAKNDVVVGLDAISTLLKYITNVKLVIYPTGGHFLMHLHGQSMAHDIINFCKNSFTEYRVI